MRELLNWRWQYILYPFWRRQMPPFLRPLTNAILDRAFPTYIDKLAVSEAAQIARYWVAAGIVVDDVAALTRHIQAAANDQTLPIAHADVNATPRRYDGAPVRIVAQWQPMERVLMRFGTFYPPAWAMHASMLEAISHVASAEVLVDDALWAHAIHAYLQRHTSAQHDNIHYLVLPTNDIWIRDYGALMGVNPDGERVAVNPTYAVLPQYPQADDDAMTLRWAAHHHVPVLPLALHLEGGNVWADTVGTLIMTTQLFYSNPYYERDTLEAYLHSVLDYDKLIIAPRLTLEETGHIDLLAKLVNDDTILLTRASSPTTAEVTRKLKRLFTQTRNAAGTPYRILELPTPPLYINWGIHTIRRAYTNALTVNDAVLVPVYNIAEDEEALRTYEQAYPQHRIIPIDAQRGINGGGAVHCMTREVPL